MMNYSINLNKLSRVAKAQLYIDRMTPVLNKRALFSDGTENFRSPAEPDPGDEVTLRFRTAAANADVVYIVYGKERRRMQLARRDALFDYYEARFTVGEENTDYYFEIPSTYHTYYYNRNGVSEKLVPEYNFCIMPGYHTPDWAKGAVFYQIFVDRFCNGDPSNDVLDQEYCYIGEGTVRVTDWYKYPAAMGVREFYGGDLKGVMKKLDYLQDLGVEVIYFNPLFVSPSNHKYDIQDYDYIDPHFGVIIEDEGECLPPGETSNRKATRYITRVTSKVNLEASNQLFIRLVEEIHKRGMRVIIDGVFNHCGSFNKWLDREQIYENAAAYEKGAYVAADSPYTTFFRFREDGSWPYNKAYDGWWGHDTLPKLNYEQSEKLYDYIMKIARKWVSPPYNVDGWRLDVAADLGHSYEFNHNFWKDFRKNVKEANPDALILAEHYGDPAAWLMGDEWDSVMNYDAFMEPVGWFLTGVEKHRDEFRQDMIGRFDYFYGSMRHYMSRFNTQSLLTAMNELSNHDHSRFLTRTNHKVGRVASAGAEAANQGVNKGIMRQAVVMQMTWPGAPTIYYGDEAGLCGWTDPDNRRGYPWGREDKELIAFHKELIRIHRSYQALRTGSLQMLDGDQGFISYGRFDMTDKILVAINNNTTQITVKIHAWELGMTDEDTLVRLIETTEKGYALNAVLYYLDGGILELTMQPVSAVIIKNLAGAPGAGCTFF